MNGNSPSFQLIRFRTFTHDGCGPAVPQREVLATQEELDAYLEACRPLEAAPRPVQFPGECAVAVALGRRPTTGFSVDIVAIVQENGGFVGVQHHVLYVEQAPQGPAAAQVTHPHHVVSARGIGGIVSFRQIPDHLGGALRSLFGQPATAAMAAPGAAMPASRGGTSTPVAAARPPGMTTLAVGEEHPTIFFGEHVTSFVLGEEHPITYLVGEGWPTGIVAEHPPTLAGFGEGPLTPLAGEDPVSDPRLEDPLGGQGSPGSFG